VNRVGILQLATLAALFGMESLPGQTTTPPAPLTEQQLLNNINKLGAAPPKKPLGLEGTPLEKKPAGKPPRKAKGQTEITSKQATFDQKTRQAVFIGNVVVKDPEFNVTCDRLIADLKKPANGADKLAPDPPPAADPVKNPGAKGGGLEKAVAEANPGGVVIITQEKIESDGSISLNIGKARKATYDAVTGNIVLTGMPSVQQGINVCSAKDENTVMILNRDGNMTVEGDSKTTINDSASLDGLRGN
jgi:lipopolysaccharide export system protein LptA